MKRSEILEEAAKIVTTDREEQYGSPENNFEVIAALWDEYLLARRYFKGFRFKITAHDVAIMMCLLKIARIATGQPKADNYIDLAGYTACAGEIGLEGAK